MRKAWLTTVYVLAMVLCASVSSAVTEGHVAIRLDVPRGDSIPETVCVVARSTRLPTGGAIDLELGAVPSLSTPNNRPVRSDTERSYIYAVERLGQELGNNPGARSPFDDGAKNLCSRATSPLLALRHWRLAIEALLTSPADAGVDRRALPFDGGTSTDAASHASPSPSLHTRIWCDQTPSAPGVLAGSLLVVGVSTSIAEVELIAMRYGGQSIFLDYFHRTDARVEFSADVFGPDFLLRRGGITAIAEPQASLAIAARCTRREIALPTSAFDSTSVSMSLARNKRQIAGDSEAWSPRIEVWLPQPSSSQDIDALTVRLHSDGEGDVAELTASWQGEVPYPLVLSLSNFVFSWRAADGYAPFLPCPTPTLVETGTVCTLEQEQQQRRTPNCDVEFGPQPLCRYRCTTQGVVVEGQQLQSAHVRMMSTLGDAWTIPLGVAGALLDQPPPAADRHTLVVFSSRWRARDARLFPATHDDIDEVNIVTAGDVVHHVSFAPPPAQLPAMVLVSAPDAAAMDASDADVARTDALSVGADASDIAADVRVDPQWNGPWSESNASSVALRGPRDGDSVVVRLFGAREFRARVVRIQRGTICVEGPLESMANRIGVSLGGAFTAIAPGVADFPTSPAVFVRASFEYHNHRLVLGGEPSAQRGVVLEAGLEYTAGPLPYVPVRAPGSLPEASLAWFNRLALDVGVLFPVYSRYLSFEPFASLGYGWAIRNADEATTRWPLGVIGGGVRSRVAVPGSISWFIEAEASCRAITVPQFTAPDFRGELNSTMPWHAAGDFRFALRRSF